LNEKGSLFYPSNVGVVRQPRRQIGASLITGPVTPPYIQGTQYLLVSTSVRELPIMNSIVRKSRMSAAVRTALSCTILAAAPLLATGVAHAAPPEFFAFESGHVRPMAMSADGTKLYAVNTPNNTLEIFNVTSSGLQFAGRVTVGLEPVAVAVRNDNEVWVVNHLSDSVSIVNVSGTPRRSEEHTS